MLMLIEKIDQDYIAAYKARDEVAKASLGNAKAAIKSALIEKREALTDDEVRAILGKKVKQHKDSISEFEKGNRADLVIIETAQMKILEKYLPAQMDDGAVREMVKAVISETSATAK